jgi:NAD(P)-dependent dehydrogenase (short-subunit alcohol dehydrogenase family)
MKDFQDKIAVITGAASGIGKAVAEKCVREGMKVVLADIEDAALERTVKEFRAIGADALLAVKTDVSKAAQIEALAEKTLHHYGAVHFVFNNAGVAVGGPIWEHSYHDWDWIMGVNLWGVIYGVKTFVPIMLQQDSEAHMVNTASLAGLMTSSRLGAYHVTKHGVVALSESLYLGLREQNAKIGVSVLCPGWVSTKIHESERNRPDELSATPKELTPEEIERRDLSRQVIEQGIPPSEVANLVFDAMLNDRFYINTHPDMLPIVQMRMENILNSQNPFLMLS